MKTLICVPVHNRFATAEVCLNQLISTSPARGHIRIVDDGSDNAQRFYDDMQLVPEVASVKYQDHQGIDRTRVDDIQTFWDAREFDYLYLTDSDALHDPDWFDTAVDLLHMHNLPVSLYRSNTNIHKIDPNGIASTAPGISMFMSRYHVAMIIPLISALTEGCSFDFQICRMLPRWIYPTRSYVEHYGAGGLHNRTMDCDRAVNPTLYLSEVREAVLQEIAAGM